MKKPKDICKNCLYFGSDGRTCAHADNNGKPMLQINKGKACVEFWLNQHKFPHSERHLYY